MKNFLKTFLASFISVSICGIFFFFMITSAIGDLSDLFNFGEKEIKMPSEAVLVIDMSQITLQEQTEETPLLSMLTEENPVQPMGTLDLVAAINAASFDDAVKYIYLKPDGVTGGIAQIEEIRKALKQFRQNGKAVVSYMENPTTGGYYLASVSDKVYMTPHEGGLSTFNGLSSRMIFLKDALDRLGINVQLIRHGKYKSAGEMFVRNSSSKENLQQTEDMVGSMWNAYRIEIAMSREIDVYEIDRILDELELNSPQDFLDKGLVDELLTVDQLQDKMAMLFMTDDYSNVESISIQDYATLNTAGNPQGSQKIAVIYAEGEIMDGYSYEEVASDRFVRIIQDIRNDDAVKAVVLRVNSPGGSVLASEKIKAQIDSLRTKVPVIASFGDYAASGGYWISANCDYIYANETTLTGSIGVFSMVPDIKNTLNDILHVNITAVNSNSHADMYDMTRPLNQQEIKYLQTSVENIYDRFLNIVAEGRGMTAEEVDAVAQGRVWTGAQAEQIGLVDDIGTIEDAIIHAASLVDEYHMLDNIQIVEYPKPITTMDILNSMITGEELVKISEPFKSVYTAFKSWNSSQSGKVYARLPYIIDIR